MLEWIPDPACSEWFVTTNGRYQVYELRPGQWRAVQLPKSKVLGMFPSAEDAQKQCAFEERVHPTGV